MSVQQTLKFWRSVVEDKNEDDDICPKCETKVYRSLIRLRGRNWHKECFQCANCKKALNLATYTEVNNDIFCSECYAECFSRRWRCSEVIDSRRLSKQLKNVVMEGHHFRWLPPKVSNDSDSLDSASFDSAATELPQVVPDSGRKAEDSTGSPCSVDEADSYPSENQTVRQRAQTYTPAERPASTRIDNACVPTLRPMRRIARGRMTASEGIPGQYFVPSALFPDGIDRALDEEIKVLNVRLRDTPARKSAVEQPDASGLAGDERKYSKIYSIVETSEDSEGADSVESRSESNSSGERPPPVPPKPERLRKSSSVSATTVLGVARLRDRKPSGPPTRRHTSAHCVRHSRFPSDHLADFPVLPQPDSRN